MYFFVRILFWHCHQLFIYMIKILQLYTNTYIANLWMKDSYFCSMTFILTQPETSIQLIPCRSGVHKITSKSLKNHGCQTTEMDKNENMWYLQTQRGNSCIWLTGFICVKPHSKQQPSNFRDPVIYTCLCMLPVQHYRKLFIYTTIIITVWLRFFIV